MARLVKSRMTCQSRFDKKKLKDQLMSDIIKYALIAALFSGCAHAAVELGCEKIGHELQVCHTQIADCYLTKGHMSCLKR